MKCLSVSLNLYRNTYLTSPRFVCIRHKKIKLFATFETSCSCLKVKRPLALHSATECLKLHTSLIILEREPRSWSYQSRFVQILRCWKNFYVTRIRNRWRERVGDALMNARHRTQLEYSAEKKLFCMRSPELSSVVISMYVQLVCSADWKLIHSFIVNVEKR